LPKEQVPLAETRDLIEKGGNKNATGPEKSQRLFQPLMGKKGGTGPASSEEQVRGSWVSP